MKVTSLRISDNWPELCNLFHILSVSIFFKAIINNNIKTVKVFILSVRKKYSIGAGCSNTARPVMCRGYQMTVVPTVIFYLLIQP